MLIPGLFAVPDGTVDPETVTRYYALINDPVFGLSLGDFRSGDVSYFLVSDGKYMLFACTETVRVPVPYRAAITQTTPSVPRLGADVGDGSGTVFEAIMVEVGDVKQASSPAPHGVRVVLLGIAGEGIPPVWVQG